MSRQEANTLATQQHDAIKTIILDKPLYSVLQEKLSEIIKGRRELQLLDILLDSKKPISGENIRSKFGIARSVVSDNIKSLNKYLQQISNALDPFKTTNTTIRIRSSDKNKGLFVGYYLGCLDRQTNQYLDGPAIQALFQDHWNKAIHEALRQLLKEDAEHNLAIKLNNKNDYQFILLKVKTGKKHMQQPAGAVHDGDINNCNIDYNQEWEAFDTKKLLEPHDIYIISSETGTGKTTFLYHLQLEILAKKEYYPIMIHASKIDPALDHDINAFITQIKNAIPLHYPETYVNKFLIDHHDRIILIIDGIDQIKGEGTEYSYIIDYILRNIKTKIIIASRPFALLSCDEKTNIQFLRLRPFSLQTQERYFGKYYDRACEICISCRYLMGIPMLAYMVRTLIEKGKDELITNRADLYKEFVSYILRPTSGKGYKHENLKSTRDTETRVIQALAEISFQALALKNSYLQKIPVDFCERYSRTHQTSIETILKHGLVNLLENDTGSEGFLYFSHQSFQEYLAAKWMSIKPEKFNYVLNQGFGYKWEASIKLLAGIQGIPVIKKILTSNCYPSEQQRVFLAMECLEEIGEIRNKSEAEFAAGLALESYFDPYYNDSSCGGRRSIPSACMLTNYILNKCMKYLAPDKTTNNEQ